MNEHDTRTVWMVLVNTDLTEGKGRNIPIYICASETTARRMGRKRNVQGSDADVIKAEAIFHNGRWCAPVQIHEPTTEDRNEDYKLEQARQADQRRHEALQRAREAGLSEEDIAILRGKP
ncbi:hypothetical protein [Metapseudomonas sp. CR1201]